MELHHPVDFQVDYPENLSPLVLIFVKLPSYLLGVVSGLAAAVVIVLSVVAIPVWFIILVSGRYPKPVFVFSVGLLQWTSRLAAWPFMMRDDWSLFGTTRRIQVMAGLGAGVFLIFGLSPWFSLSVPGAAFSSGPVAVMGTLRLEEARSVGEAQDVLGAFMMALAIENGEDAASYTSHGSWNDRVQDLLSCDSELLRDFVAVQYGQWEFENETSLRLNAYLTYESAPDLPFEARLFERPEGWRLGDLRNSDRFWGTPLGVGSSPPAEREIRGMAVDRKGNFISLDSTDTGLSEWMLRPGSSASRLVLVFRVFRVMGELRPMPNCPNPGTWRWTARETSSSRISATHG